MLTNCVIYLQQKAPHQPSSQYLQPSKLKHFQSCEDNVTHGALDGDE
jgi:hypothetical protein